MSLPQTPSSNCSRENTRPGRSIRNSSSRYSVGPRSTARAAARHALLLPVELEVAEAQHIRRPRSGAGAAQQRADARQQFGDRERLDDIVVGAGGEAADALAFLAARGQHDDRQLPWSRAGAQAPAELDAGQARQHPVEDHEIGRAFLQLAGRPRRRAPRCRPRNLRPPDCSAAAVASASSSSTIRMRGFIRTASLNCRPRLSPKASRVAFRPLRRRWCALRSCNRPFRRYWWRGRPCARCSWRRTSGGCRR